MMNLSYRKDLLDEFLKLKELKKLFNILLPFKNHFRFIGGCVRNALLKKEVADYDIATDLLPEEVIKILEENNVAYHAAGLKHGTVSAIIEKMVFEITTLRIDEECDGRRANVTFTNSWEEDTNRRDFTVNALGLDFDGKLYDYHDGLNDLNIGKIKFIGDSNKRINEDYLRILRWFRFYSYYGNCELDKETLEICKQNASNIHKLSGERIYQEFKKIILSEKAHEVVNVMYKYNILQCFGFEFKTNFIELQNIIEFENRNNIPSNFIRRLFTIIQNNEENFSKINNRLKLSRKEYKQLQILHKFETKNFYEIIFYEGNEIAYDFLVLNKLNITEFKNILSEEIKLPVQAADLIKLGFKPGKELGEILRKCEEKYIDSKFSLSRDNLLDLIANL